MLAGEVTTTSPGRTPGSFSRKRSKGRLVPIPVSRPWRWMRPTQTPTRLPGSVSRATVAVLGVTLATRPIRPPGAVTLMPGRTPCRAPLPITSCCHQPPGWREITGADTMLLPPVCSCNSERSRRLSSSSWLSLVWLLRISALRSHSPWALPGQKGRLSKA